MLNVYNNILDLKDRFDIFIFDAYGVFWNGNGFYHKSIENIKELYDYGKLVYILSNSTQTSLEAEESYKKKGLFKGIHYREIVTSGEVLRSSFLNGNVFKKNSKIWQYGIPNISLFSGLDCELVDNVYNSDYIYISTPQIKEDRYKELLKNFNKNIFFESKRSLDYGERLFDSISSEVFIDDVNFLFSLNIPFIVANLDIFASEVDINNNLHFVIRNGAISDMLKNLGSNIIEFGKPNEIIYNFLFEIILKDCFSLDKNRICMVGDTIKTDIKGANNACISSVLCFKTGVTYNSVYNLNNKMDNEMLINKIKEIEIKEEANVNFYIESVGNLL